MPCDPEDDECDGKNEHIDIAGSCTDEKIQEINDFQMMAYGKNLGEKLIHLQDPWCVDTQNLMI